MYIATTPWKKKEKKEPKKIFQSDTPDYFLRISNMLLKSQTVRTLFAWGHYLGYTLPQGISAGEQGRFSPQQYRYIPFFTHQKKGPAAFLTRNDITIKYIAFQYTSIRGNVIFFVTSMRMVLHPI